MRENLAYSGDGVLIGPGDRVWHGGKLRTIEHVTNGATRIYLETPGRPFPDTVDPGEVRYFGADDETEEG
ncbi:hypothetical protein L0U85_04870 [Glycomyces sp. L485]|uniref:hypothetical protein n=1 Tax=Glycomyces sp. L485 TaxID=2909235 RepID=UPI001F4BC82B|nr:hypothetical protein [Glycomyces sp. L485]MCH7230196.1 hypothetical protein [Glycomyces sp. L485]